MSEIRGYTRQQLFEMGPQRSFSGEAAREVAFPIGGIGTGCVSLSGIGELVDWEIFNRPNKGSYLPNTFFLLWAQAEGEEPVTKIVQGRPLPSFTGTPNPHHGRFGEGLWGGRGIGLPHMASSTFRGEYPFAYIDFQDDRMPVSVTLEAYNPFIPLNVDDSSIPVAIFRFHLHNPGAKPVRVSLAASLMNAVGYEAPGPFLRSGPGGTMNRYVEGEDLRGIYMTAEGIAPDDHRFGSMMLATSWKEVAVKTCWERAAWFDAVQMYWDEFSATGTLQDRSYSTPSEPGTRDTGALALKATLQPGESVIMPVYIAWHFPVFRKYWHRRDSSGAEPQYPTWRNYYSKLWDDAFAVAQYVAWNEDRLYQDTKRFHDALFGSTLPWYVLDAISSQMSILKTPTCLLLEDGTFYGFEGTCLERGCCEGSCTHVWNYAQALPFLFPTLERSMREADYKYNQREDGWMCFRLQLPLGSPPWSYHAAADGQMGGIMKVYRDWKLSGDEAWLRRLWPRVRNALEYAWQQWDADKDGVMEGIQHNTYDIEFSGPNTMTSSFYLGALRAAEEMARHLGEENVAAEYHALYRAGRAKIEEMLFNGEYYVQKPDWERTPKYQYGEGCLSDQMIGQWLARLMGLGDLFDPQRVRTTLASIYKYNWRTNFFDHACCQRIYALGDEKGLLLCTWPHGNRPALPFVYSDEVWPGIEYQVASHMIYEGLLEEGLCIVRGVRERHDGVRRNPWNEFECGSHYARSMAAWALLTALSGFSFDLPNKRIGFDPRFRKEDFATFWSVGSGWGTFKQKLTTTGGTMELQVLYGALELKELALGWTEEGQVAARLNGEPVTAKLRVAMGGSTVTFEAPLYLRPGSELEIALSAA